MSVFPRKENEFLNSRKRDRVEIIAAIIAITEKAATKTNIMEKVNLNHPQTSKYIQLMVKRGLINRASNDKKTVYEQTEKGCKFFRTYCELLRILYGAEFINHKKNLAIACLSQCQIPHLMLKNEQ